MSEMFAIFLTTVFIFAILKYQQNKKLNKLVLKKILFRQSVMHETLKYFLPSNSVLRIKKNTQSKKHSERNTTKIITTPDNKVYWVANNVFYCADMIDGEFDPATAKPIDTQNLSKKQLNELLFILDTLKNG